MCELLGWGGSTLWNGELNFKCGTPILSLSNFECFKNNVNLLIYLFISFATAYNKIIIEVDMQTNFHEFL